MEARKEVATEELGNMRQMMKTTERMSEALNIKETSAEPHVHISLPELSDRDFEFIPPRGAVLKELLFV